MSGSNLITTTRVDQWWKPKATNLLAILYSVMLIAEMPFSMALRLLVPSLVTILGIGTVGHLLNDWSDVRTDLIAGKRNHLARLSSGLRWALLGGALVVALLPWAFLPLNSTSVLLLSLQFALLFTYALPPIRLKERPIWAPLTDSGYAYAVPAVLAAHTFHLAANRSFDRWLLAAILIWQLALGVRHYLNHVALDRINDIATATPTVATRHGNQFLHRLIRRILPLECLVFVVYLILLSHSQRLVVYVVLGLFLALSSLHIILTLGRSYPLVPYRFSRSNLDRLYQDFLPLSLLAFLAVRDWRYSLLIPAHAAVSHLPGWRRLLATRASRAGRLLGGILASPLIFVRALTGPGLRGGSQSRARGPDTQRRTGGPEGSAAFNPAFQNIAIANINEDKYTETFIHGLVPRLRYNVHYLYGGELPRFDDDGRHFLSNWPSLQTLAKFLESLFGLERNYFLRNSIASYLQARRVRLVLAQFGPVGVELLPITRDLGIPLVVYFHAYEVFHDEMLERCGEQYEELFREADRIIGVSEVMIERLHELGAPRSRLLHLPAFVDLDLFPYADHSGAGAHFLAVGRFTETKSPHLTILAFQRVAERVPEATLTMVGEGGGGELFEACLILVRALGLEERVVFKGVLAHRDVAREMSRARVFVQHSVTTPVHGDMEGKPVAVMEAMACGLPVVTTRHSGIVELIEDKESGFLVDEYDVQAMAEVMVSLARSDELVTRIGRSASSAVRNHPLIGNHIEILDETIAAAIARG